MGISIKVLNIIRLWRFELHWETRPLQLSLWWKTDREWSSFWQREKWMTTRILFRFVFDCRLQTSFRDKRE